MSPETKLDAFKADFGLGQRPPLSAISLRDRPLICAALISLAAAALISEAPRAVAQDQTTTPHIAAAAASEEQRFIIDSDLAISKMSLAMTEDNRAGDVDRDFVALMLPHQQGAIDIAQAELKFGHNDALRQLARDIIAERERETSAMRGAVGETSSAQGAPRR